METPDFHFITEWIVRGNKAEVAELINKPLDLPLWWPSVYLGVEKIREEGKDVYKLFTKGWLPYTIKWEFRELRKELPDLIELSADGDLQGHGLWTFHQENDYVRIMYDWKVMGNKALFRKFKFFLNPLFRFNHNWAMRKGLKSIQMELDRIRKGLNRHQAPTPPLATFPHRHFYKKNLKLFGH